LLSEASQRGSSRVCRLRSAAHAAILLHSSFAALGRGSAHRAFTPVFTFRRCRSMALAPGYGSDLLPLRIPFLGFAAGRSGFPHLPVLELALPLCLVGRFAPSLPRNLFAPLTLCFQRPSGKVALAVSGVAGWSSRYYSKPFSPGSPSPALKGRIPLARLLGSASFRRCLTAPSLLRSLPAFRSTGSQGGGICLSRFASNKLLRASFPLPIQGVISASFDTTFFFFACAKFVS